MTEDITKAMPSYHVFTGCDRVSAFASKRKLS